MVSHRSQWHRICLMTLSNRLARFLIYAFSSLCRSGRFLWWERMNGGEKGKNETGERANKKLKARRKARGREAPMIYGGHYDLDNYMLPYSRPLLHAGPARTRASDIVKRSVRTPLSLSLSLSFSFTIYLSLIQYRWYPACMLLACLLDSVLPAFVECKLLNSQPDLAPFAFAKITSIHRATRTYILYISWDIKTVYTYKPRDIFFQSHRFNDSYLTGDMYMRCNETTNYRVTLHTADTSLLAVSKFNSYLEVP